MESDKTSNKCLEEYTYRQLQQMAKAMNLPSNYKKIYLIELIKAKMFKTDLDVCNIINRAKQDRLRSSKYKKNHKAKMLQAREACSKISYSPSITVTPKRPSDIYMKYSQELKKAVVSLHPKRSLLQNIDINTNAISSDRVLRSYNLKTAKPNYALMNDSACNFKPKCVTNPTEMKIKFVTNGGSISQFNLTTKCYERQNTANRITDNPKPVLKRKFIITHEKETQKPMPSRRQRTISGIYPLEPEDNVPRSLSFTESVCIRKIDGTYTKVNAVVQKNNTNLLTRKTECLKTNINIQDIINESVDANIPDNFADINANNDYSKILYPIIANDTSPNNNNDNNLNGNEQKLYPTLQDKQHNVKLPNIHDVFSQFNDIYGRDQTQPNYMQASAAFGINDNNNLTNVNCNSDNNNLTNVNCNSKILETIYNIKVDSPILPVCTIADTKCVFSTHIVVSPTTYQNPVLPSSDALNVSYLRGTSSLNTLQTCHEMGASLSIPEMVEDALEIISQDGDYMEQTGMDIRVQCVMCSWAGPKIILECHVQKEHSLMIHKVFKREWNMTFTLESLVQSNGWLNRLVEYDSVLYVLTAKYEDPGCLMAVLLSLSAELEPIERTVTLTMYNKITGEPFTWNGRILPHPADLKYENSSDCLRVDLSKLDLLPNSANLKLVNRELVTESPSKVVVGQRVLNDIHIILFVKIFEVET